MMKILQELGLEGDKDSFSKEKVSCVLAGYRARVVSQARLSARKNGGRVW